MCHSGAMKNIFWIEAATFSGAGTVNVFQKLQMKIVSKFYRNTFFRSWALQPLTNMVIFVISCMYASNSKLLMLSASATLFTYENDATYFWCIQFVELLSGKNKMIECRMTWPFSTIYTQDLVKQDWKDFKS